MIMEPRYSLPGICSELRNFTMPFYDIYKMHQKFASSPYSISLICIKFENRFEGRKFVVYCKEYFLDFVLFSCERCMDSECFLEWKKNLNSEYCRNNIYEIFPIMNKKCAVGMGYQNEFEFCKFGRGKVLRLRLYYYFISCFIYLFIYKYGILDFSLLHHCLKKFDCMNEWVKHHSRCIGISTRDRLHDNVRIEENNVKNISRIVEYTGEMLDFKRNFCGGGRHQTAISGEIIYEYLHTCTDIKVLNNRQYFIEKEFDFKRYELLSTISNDVNLITSLFYSRIPLDRLTNYLNKKELREMSDLHKLAIPYRCNKEEMLTYFKGHHCCQCDLYVSVFTERASKKKIIPKEEERESNHDLSSKFPPEAPSKKLIELIIGGFCDDTAPEKLVERGCAVCGKLLPINSMALLNEINCQLNVISPGDVGRCERLHESDPVAPLDGPILAEGCDHVCATCEHFLKKNEMPPESLANSFWIGPVPSILQNLMFAEKMLISRIRHNKCLVRVSSGRAKMTANVIMFSNPTVKVYHALPPSRREVSEILAFVFRGPIQPTDSDIKRTPMLVRRNVVKDALEWLKLNHVDYEDLHISIDNLNDYPLVGVPVNIEYSKTDADSENKISSAMSVFDNEFDDGTTDGPCPFTVHGLTGPEFENMSMDRLKVRALQHLADKGLTLGISHDSKPQSMYDNPQAYPQMFPWLFPYGFGGIGQKCHSRKISEATQKLNLLMYCDKRFQTDFYFPMVAFNHEQLKAGITGSFLLAKRKKWPDISNRLKNLNHNVLKNISNRLSEGSRFSTTTVEEKNCFQLLNDLDHVGGFVKGSITSKRHMRNEIWSMISQLGAPSWFITLSPADNRHPICLYYADKDIEFKPKLRSGNERNLLVAQNPVAASRFFDLMVRMFIKHVLGVGTDHPGLYGDTAGYYGTVEQQGRLTLHLHTVLWIKNALSPQEIRNRLMNNDCGFKQSLVQYLEGCQKGEFFTGSMEHIKNKIPIDVENRSKGIHTILESDSSRTIEKTYHDPTLTLPEKPPNSCESKEHESFCNCNMLNRWWSKFYDIVDDILLRSNVHKCSSSDPEKSKFKAKGCLNKNGICKARFP